MRLFLAGVIIAVAGFSMLGPGDEQPKN